MRKCLFTGALLLLTATPLHASLIDTFNSENGGNGQLNYNHFTNWTVANASSNGSVDLIGNGFFDFYPGNGLYVDLGGSTNGPGGLLTTKQVFGAGTYQLSFDLAGSARGPNENVDVNFGPFSHNYFLPSSQGYTLFSQTVTLTTPSQLSFQNVNSGNIGAILDNVSVTNVVPEPSSLGLLAMGFLAICGFGVWRRGACTA
jgi:hypothetical protein